MALIAHYPLNGDLNDISGNDYHLTNYGATVDNNGKIGKCYNFDGSGDVSGTPTGAYLGIDESITNTGTSGGYTYSFWINVDTDATDRIALLYGAGTIRHIEIYSSGKHFRTEAALQNGKSFGSGVFPDEVRGKWSHFVIVFDNTLINRPVRWYQNGVLFYTGYMGNGTNSDAEYFSFNSIGRATGSTSYLYAPSFKGKMNDFRIYDHALSDKEIYDISKAKILHYSFNDMQEPTTNLLPIDDSKWVINKSNYQGTCTLISNSESWITTGAEYQFAPRQDPESGGWQVAEYRHYYTSYDITKQYTLSFDLYIDSALTSWFQVAMKNPNGQNAVLNNVAISPSAYGDNWFRYDVTFTPLIATGVGTSIHITSNDDARFKIANPQLEQKDHATPFAVSTRGGSVTDISGFGNHATLAESTTPRWVEDSKLGSGCYDFGSNTDSKVIQRANPLIIGADELTLSAWVYPKGSHTDDRGIIIQENGNFYLTLTTSQQVSVYWYDTSPSGYHTTTETLPLNQWSHIASVWDGTFNKIFINGSLVKQTPVSTPGRASSSTPITIGREKTNRIFNGKIDEPKIYATALSDDDILKLYQERAALDNKGTLNVNEINSAIEETDDTNDVKFEINSCPYGLTEYPNGVNTYLKINDVRVGYQSRGFNIFVADRSYNPYEYAYFDTYAGTSNNEVHLADGALKIDYGVQTSREESQRRMNEYLATIPDGYLVAIANFDAGYVTVSELYETLAKYFQVETPQSSIYHRNGWYVFAEKNGMKFGELYTGISVSEAYGVYYLKKKINWVNEKGILDVCNFSEVGITDGLVGYWKLKGDIFDYSGNMMDGTIHDVDSNITIGSDYIDIDTQANSDLDDGYILAENSENIELNRNFSWCGMLNVNDIKETGGSSDLRQGIIEKGNYTEDFSIMHDGSALYLLNSNGVGGYIAKAVGGCIEPAGIWAHYAITRNQKTGDVCFYKNGVLVNTQNIGAEIDIRHTTAKIELCGAYVGSMNGKAKEFKLFNRVLTPEEIAIEHKFLTKSEDDKIIMTNNKIYIDCIKEGL